MASACSERLAESDATTTAPRLGSNEDVAETGQVIASARARLSVSAAVAVATTIERARSESMNRIGTSGFGKAMPGA
jgi:hypothetical protein